MVDNKKRRRVYCTYNMCLARIYDSRLSFAGTHHPTLTDRPPCAACERSDSDEAEQAMIPSPQSGGRDKIAADGNHGNPGKASRGGT